MNNILIVAIVLIIINSIIDVLCFIYEDIKFRKLKTELQLYETKFEDLKHNYESFKGVIFDNYQDIKKLYNLIMKLHGDDLK